MCVRELRSTEAPNVIVFYLAFISSLGALTGIIGQVRSCGLGRNRNCRGCWHCLAVLSFRSPCGHQVPFVTLVTAS